MWPLPVSLRTVVLALAGLFVIAALWYVHHAIYQQGFTAGKAAGDLAVAKMYQAGVEATNRRELAINELRGKAREDADRIAVLSRGARVRTCPTVAADRLPGSADADPAGTGGAGGEDITGLIRQCLRTFGEVNRALGVK